MTALQCEKVDLIRIDRIDQEVRLYQTGDMSSDYARHGFADASRLDRWKPISIPVACGLLIPIEALLIIASGAVAYFLWLTGDPYSSWTDYALIVALGTLLAINAFYFSGLYDPAIATRPGAATRKVVLRWAMVALALMAASFVTKTGEDYSRFWAGMWFGFGLVSLLVTRWVFARRIDRWAAEGRLDCNVAIVGSGAIVPRLARELSSDPGDRTRVAGIFSLHKRSVQASDRDRLFDGDLDDLVRRVRQRSIDTVILAEPGLTVEQLDTVTDRMRQVAVDVRICPGPLALRLAGRGVSHYAGIPALNVLDRPFNDWRQAMKELEDRVLAALILTMISPVMLVIAALVKLDSPGPVFFRQKRYGLNNQLIEVLKFRTMRHDLSDSNAEQLTQRNDPRVTRLGSFLRRTSLDELPQFINVVRGEMSIVGPRPHAVSAKAGEVLYQDAVRHYAWRHRVKPGITGWAQINGWRGTTSTVRQIEKRVEYDLYYIENWSLRLDLKIIVMTVFKGLAGQNAY